MKNEIWKNIKGYEGLYEISSLGGVKSLNYNRTGSEKILKPALKQNGYFYVGLHKDGKVKNFYVHRLVAQEFLLNPNELPQINHKNENKTDNRLENLEWVSAKDNINWGTRNERASFKKINGKNSIPVVQFDKNGNFIKEWVSFHQVERELGICQSNIVKCCKGRYKSAGGFKWVYK